MFDPQASFKTEHKKRIAWQKKGVLRFLLLLTVLSALCAAAIGVSYLFRIRSVGITGNVHYSSEELLETAGVKTGVPLSSVNLKVVSETLRENYLWIREVQTEKNLFGEVHIRVTEYTAAYSIRAANGDFLASSDLMVLERTEEGGTDGLPVVYLPDGRLAETGKTCAEWKEEPTALARITEALAACEKLTDVDVTGIDIGTRFYYRLRTAKGVTIVLGDTESLALKLELVTAVFAENRDKTWSHAEINVSDVKKATFRIID